MLPPKMRGTITKCSNTLDKTHIWGISQRSFPLLLFLLLLLPLSSHTVFGGWGGGGRGAHAPRVSIDYVHGPLADTITRFNGNQTHTDNFKIVVEDGQALFVGGT